ncbi:MAG: putative O-glycosylation ligase, exosortase A system-associated, partial [Rubrivivax sp.]
RGGLLAVSAMGLLMWWRGRNRFVGGVVIACIALLLVAFMPDQWGERMQTIETYQEDRSAMGRIAAWNLAWNASFHYPFGVGFNAARQELFLAFSDYGLEFGTPVAHSIYFQVLGHHGLGGLAIFLIMWVVTYRWAGWLRVHGAQMSETKWVSDLGAMCQVSLVGYAVGGAFLSLAYFDLPYIVMVLVVVSRAWLEKRRWQTEIYPLRAWWHRVPGLRGPGGGLSEVQMLEASAEGSTEKK